MQAAELADAERRFHVERAAAAKLAAELEAAEAAQASAEAAEASAEAAAAEAGGRPSPAGPPGSLRQRGRVSFGAPTPAVLRAMVGRPRAGSRMHPRVPVSSSTAPRVTLPPAIGEAGAAAAARAPESAPPTTGQPQGEVPLLDRQRSTTLTRLAARVAAREEEEAAKAQVEEQARLNWRRRWQSTGEANALARTQALAQAEKQRATKAAEEQQLARPAQHAFSRLGLCGAHS